jgi:O-antigen ligase
MVHRLVISSQHRQAAPVWLLVLGALAMALAQRFGSVNDLVLVVLAATTVLSFVLWNLGRPAGSLLPETSVWSFAVLLLASAAGSVLVNDRVPWTNLIILSCHLALFWLGWGLSRHAEGLRQLTVGFIGCAALIATYGVAQFYRWDPLPTNLEFPDRILSVFENPNHLGNLMAAALPLTLACLLKSESKRAVVIWQLTCAVLYAGLLMAGSRGAWISGLVGGLVLSGGYVLHWRRGSIHIRPVLILTTLGLLGLVTLGVSRRPVLTRPSGPVTMAQRALSTTKIVGPAAKRDATVNHRYFIWGVASRMVAAAPVLGHGYGDFGHTFATFRDDPGAARQLARLSWSQRRDPTAYAHNELLHTWVETGLLGLIGLVGLIAVTLIRAWKYLMLRTESLFYWGAMGVLGVFLIHSAVSYPLRLPLNGSIFWILLGIMIRWSYGSIESSRMND